jgi:hypothetical protein
MPRLLKRILPATRNPLLEVDDRILSVIEYSGLSYALSQHGYSNESKFMLMAIIGVSYEVFLKEQYGRQSQKASGDNEPFLRNRATTSS